MIAKLHSLFLWSALAISVCIGFSVAVIVNEAHASAAKEIQCDRSDLSVQYPFRSEDELEKFAPKKFTFPPPYWTGSIRGNTKRIKSSLNMGRWGGPSTWMTWNFFDDGTLIADVMAGRVVMRYRCSGGVTEFRKYAANERNSENLLSTNKSLDVRGLADDRICDLAAHNDFGSGKIVWRSASWTTKFLDEAHRRGLTCGVDDQPYFLVKTVSSAAAEAGINIGDQILAITVDGLKYSPTAFASNFNKILGHGVPVVTLRVKGDQGRYRFVAIRTRDGKSALDANIFAPIGIEVSAVNFNFNELRVASKSTNQSDNASLTNNQSEIVTSAAKTLRSNSDQKICSLATRLNASDDAVWRGSAWSRYVDEAKRRGLTCGVGESVTEEIASNATAPTPVAPSVSSAAPLTPSASASKPSPVEDAIPPTISIASNTAKGPQAKIEGRVFDEAGIAEVIIDGSAVSLGGDGSFTASFYIPRSGKTVEIVAFDSKGNKATKSLVLERGQMRDATGPSFASLNPSGKRVKPNQDALALIIGVADYERTPARAAYADKDAQTFYDYAMLKLGIPATNIKELVNADANEAEVRLAVKDWIARSTKKGQSDVYVFFAGHGLANQSGDDMYLLPVDGEPRLLSDTAIARKRLFGDIAAANPRSVTVFLDTCYSGTTRGTDMLIASRPIAIRAKEQAIPDGFTVMTAAAGDQTAKPLEEAKHGMFSYFLMKGMEGDADTNQDNQITAGELHTYVQQNVIQQSSGSQTPELQGDANRVLVRFQ